MLRNARAAMPLVLLLIVAGCAPYKQSLVHPKLTAVGSMEKEMDCAQLDLALDRADTVRWLIREDGGRLETRSARAARYAANVVLAVPLSVLARQPIFFPGGGHSVLNAADVRICELLQLKRYRGCPARSTALPGKDDLMLLSELEPLQAMIDAGKGDEAVLLEQRTRLLDGLRLMPTMSAHEAPESD
jgi:hypothetical protein